MWKELNRNLGRIKQKTTHNVHFQFNGPVPEEFEVTKLESSCGCTKPVFKRDSGLLSAAFTAPDVPKHLLWKGEYTTTKKIKVYSTAGNFDLTFRATIFV